MNKRELSEKLKEDILSLRAVGGGSIANAMLAESSVGNKFFVKSYTFADPLILKNEVNGLKELRRANAVKVPEVIYWDDQYLVLEFIAEGRRRKDFWELFGRQFAALHKITGKSFGFFENNFIGATPQINLPRSNSWCEFYWRNRLLYQIELMRKNGYLDSGLRKMFLKLESKMDEIIPEDAEPPCLLHGDLWSGNFMVDIEGNPVLIDPAVYYGNREADLAMTKLFGGFDSRFYAAYNEAFPFKEGWEYREPVYKLYHVLNHVNLFGGGYLSQAKRILEYYQ